MTVRLNGKSGRIAGVSEAGIVTFDRSALEDIGWAQAEIDLRMRK